MLRVARRNAGLEIPG